MFDDYLWKSYVYQTTFSNVKYQDDKLCIHVTEKNSIASIASRLHKKIDDVMTQNKLTT